jgi:hypothetical protein
VITTSLAKLFSCGGTVFHSQEFEKILKYVGKDYHSMDDDEISFQTILAITDLEYTLHCTLSRPDLSKLWRTYAIWCASLIEDYIDGDVYKQSIEATIKFNSDLISIDELGIAHENAYQKFHNYSKSAMDITYAANSCAMNTSLKDFDSSVYYCFLNSGYGLLELGWELADVHALQEKKFLEITS